MTLIKFHSYLSFKQKHRQFSEKYLEPTLNDIISTERISLKGKSFSECEEINKEIPEPNKRNVIVADEYMIESRTNDYRGSYLYHKLGNCYSFFADKNGDPLVIIGPQWFMFLGLTFLVNSLVLFVILYFYEEYETYELILGLSFLLFFQMNYTTTFIINPGFPKNSEGRRTGFPENEYKFCSECKFYIRIKANVNHCFDCGICVEGYDHHCPWTSKCIGRRNKWFFYGFMGGILLCFGFIVVSVTVTGTFCSRDFFNESISSSE